MHTSTMGYITKEEWMNGMEKLCTDSMDKLRAKRPEFEHVFYDASEFKEMYKYTFTYAKNRDQKCMEIETAVVLWTMLLSDKFPIVHDFVRFLQEKKPVRVINRDQWQSFLDFVSIDIADYDESSAWPVLFDEFVEWKREQ
ncbi:DCN1, defective in cullin neddylation 1, domain-containing 4 [Helicostylum pulchrum]|nr:DCN1, defective in cullin neddylation 1, domain-containing 4 [Helicostylum pulchrum]